MYEIKTESLNLFLYQFPLLKISYLSFFNRYTRQASLFICKCISGRLSFSWVTIKQVKQTCKFRGIKCPCSWLIITAFTKGVHWDVLGWRLQCSLDFNIHSEKQCGCFPARLDSQQQQQHPANCLLLFITGCNMFSACRVQELYRKTTSDAGFCSKSLHGCWVRLWLLLYKTSTLLTLSFLTWIIETQLWLSPFKLIRKGFVQQVKANLLENPYATVVYFLLVLLLPWRSVGMTDLFIYC